MCFLKAIHHRCGVNMAHGRGHAEETPIIFILMSTPTCNWFGLMLTFIFYYIGHCLLLVLHWIGVSVTFLVSPSVHLWGQMATPDDKGQAVVQGWGRRPGHRTCYLSGDPINIPVPCTWRQGTCRGTWEGWRGARPETPHMLLDNNTTLVFVGCYYKQ